jgi:hypothetical protein
VALSKVGSMAVRNQLGNVERKEAMNRNSHQILQWRHDSVSFEKMWHQTVVETSSTWETQAKLRSCEDIMGGILWT